MNTHTNFAEELGGDAGRRGLKILRVPQPPRLRKLKNPQTKKEVKSRSFEGKKIRVSMCFFLETK
jgi:hypothetical protein